MAHIYKRKLGKLDAICAKLKQNTNADSPTEENSDTSFAANGINGATVLNNANVPHSGSKDNNNVIGKADLNSNEIASSMPEALDFSKKDTKTPETLSISKSSNADSTNLEERSSTENERKDIESKTDETEDEVESVADDKMKTQGNTDSQSSNRRKRKSAAPRSIVQVKNLYDNLDERDDLADYEINNLNTNFPPDDNDKDERLDKASPDSIHARSPWPQVGKNHEGMNLSNFNHSKSSNASSSLSNSKDSQRSRLSSEMEHNQSTAPLDLSMNSRQSNFDDDSMQWDRTSDGDDDENSKMSEDEFESYYNRNRNLVIDENNARNVCSLNSSYGSSGENGSHLKDFAENTMNELISMYYGNGPHGAPHKMLSSKLIPKSFQNHTQPRGEGPGYSNHPMSSGDEESHDSFPPMKGIYANYVKSAAAAKAGN